MQRNNYGVNCGKFTAAPAPRSSGLNSQNARAAGGCSSIALRALQSPQRPPRIHGPRIDNQYLLQQLLSTETALGSSVEIRHQPIGQRVLDPAVMRVGLVGESQQMIGLERGALPACQLAAHS